MTSIFLYIFLVNISGVQIMMPELKLINVYVLFKLLCMIAVMVKTVLMISMKQHVCITMQI